MQLFRTRISFLSSLSYLYSSVFQYKFIVKECKMNSSARSVFLNEFEAFWKPFTIAFQILCVANYFIFRSSNFRRNHLQFIAFSVYFIAFSILHIATVVSSSTKALKPTPENSYFKHKESQLMHYVNVLAIIGSFVIHLMSHIETLFNGKHEQEIYEKLQAIDKTFATHLNHKTDYKTRRKKYIRQTILVFIFAIFLAAASAFTPLHELNDDKFFMQPIMIIPLLIIRARWCYIALFLRATADTLNDLQMLLKQQQIQSFHHSTDQRKHSDDRENIRFFREIYSDVWFIITLISDCFGWYLISFLIEFTFEMINASYWVYINQKFYGLVYLNMRKYNTTSKYFLIMQKFTFAINN